jgi:virulence factor Mce-like protein
VRLTWKLAVNLLTVVALGAGMIAWLITQLIGNSGLINEPFKVTADFAASGGVFTNQEVTYRGVLVGKVGKMSLGKDNDGVDIQLLIDPEWENKIPADVQAQVQSKSAVGEQFVNLTPVDGTVAATLEDGSHIARSQTRLPVDFQALLSSMDKVLGDLPPGQTSRAIRNLATGLRGREGDIKTILASLSTLADTFAETGGEQTRLLDNSTETGKAFLDSKDEFAAAIRAADKVFEGLGDEPAETKRFFAANDAVAREGIGLLRRQSKNYLAGIRALADLTEFQLREKESIARSFDHVPDFLHAIEDASVPWRSPDGRKFYRIRGGLILDNVPESWPCAYDNPFEYERLPHVREPRTTDENAQCEDLSTTEAASELAAALEAWASEDPQLVAQRTLWAEEGVPAFPTDGFIWPLDGVVTSPFGPRWGRMHTGIDIDGATGDPIAASAGGRVALANYVSGYGNSVIVEHENGLSTLYGHLSDIAVSTGQTVEQGQVVGLVGCTGHCFGDHLHFEIRLKGAPVDPLPYLTGAFDLFGDVVADALGPVEDVFEGGDGSSNGPGKGKPGTEPGPNDGSSGGDRKPERKPEEPRPPEVDKPVPEPTEDPTDIDEPVDPAPDPEGGELPISYE